MPDDRYQPARERAKRLEVAEATVRQWIKSGELRAIDIGKGWRIADVDLALFLQARETAASPPRAPAVCLPGPRRAPRKPVSGRRRSPR